MGKIRELGIEDLTQVKDVYMEGNGTITFNVSSEGGLHAGSLTDINNWLSTYKT